MIVLHYTAMSGPEAALARLCDPAAEVSAHYLIAGDGRIWHLVDEAARAWHAGAGAWGGVSDVNSHSIGIELDNTGVYPFAAPQILALERLLRATMARWAIAPERVIAHADMAPGRKCDPGPRFDWRRLARQGLSVWPVPRDPQDTRAEALLARVGYPVDAGLEACLGSFRDRFRPGAAGPVAHEDLALLADLAHRFPVDPAGPSA